MHSMVYIATSSHTTVLTLAGRSEACYARIEAGATVPGDVMHSACHPLRAVVRVMTLGVYLNINHYPN